MKRALILLSVAIAAVSLPGEAGATPAPAHVAFGEGFTTSSCMPTVEREFLQIDASDEAGRYGNARYFFTCAGVLLGPTHDIALSCVVIQDISGGHQLFASGTDQDGSQEYIFLRVVDGQTARFLVRSYPAGGPCGAPTFGDQIDAGIFTIQPLPSSPLQADLSLTKTDLVDPVQVGDPLRYDITVTNNGPAPASGVTIRDDLPAEVTFVSATPSQGSCSQSGQTVSCDVGVLASGEVATIRIDVTTQGAGTITNGAAVTADEADPNYSNNTDLESTVVQGETDLATCAGKQATIVGTAGTDNLVGTAGDDVIVGLGGDDTITGGGGDDKICGGDGNDTLTGGRGADDLLGGAGEDTVSYLNRLAPVTVTLDGSANDGGSQDQSGGRGDDVRSDVETVVGGHGADSLTGDGASNTLRGKGGDDTLAGLDGADVLIGNAGNDRLTGGPGADTFGGRDGNDVLEASDLAADAAIDCDGGPTPGNADVAHIDVGLDPTPVGCETTGP